jgi:hypothetical protein
MTKSTRYVGLNVHGETITAAVAAERRAPENLGQFRNSPESVRTFIEKLGDRREPKVCYEAGADGHPLFWQLDGVSAAPRPQSSTDLTIRGPLHPSSLGWMEQECNQQTDLGISE